MKVNYTLNLIILLCSGTSLAWADTASTESAWNTRLSANLGLLYDETVSTRSATNNEDLDWVFRLKGQARYTFNDSAFFFIKGSTFNSTDEVVLDSDESNTQARRYAEISQVYFNFEDIIAPGVAFDIGRKRFEEDTGLWHDRDLSLIQLSLNRTLLETAVTFGKDARAFRSDKSDYSAERQGLTHFSLFSRLQWRYNHFIDLGFHRLEDGSGPGNTVSVDVRQGTDTTDADVDWFRAGLSGSFYRDARWQVHYALLHSIQNGELTRYSATASPTLVDVKGHMSFFELKTVQNRRRGTQLGLQWVSTSGSSSATEEGRFFQTGLQSNRMSFRDLGLSVYRFNDAYRPELTNIQATGLFFATALSDRFSLGGAMNQFSRVNSSAGIGQTRYDVSLRDNGSNLGSGIDLTLRYNPNWHVETFERQSIRVRLSQFRDGGAYQSQGSKTKATARIEWEVYL